VVAWCSATRLRSFAIVAGTVLDPFVIPRGVLFIQASILIEERMGR